MYPSTKSFFDLHLGTRFNDSPTVCSCVWKSELALGPKLAYRTLRRTIISDLLFLMGKDSTQAKTVDLGGVFRPFGGLKGAPGVTAGGDGLLGRG